MKKVILKFLQIFKRIFLFFFYVFCINWKRKFFLATSLIFLLFSLWLLSVNLTGGWLNRIRFVRQQSLEQKADFVYSYELTDLVGFNDLFPLKKHSVLIDKVVVNLKTSLPKFRNPMGVFQFYLRVDSKKTAIKIKHLQNLILDRVQREIEEFTYDEVISLEGKKELKSVIQDSVNDILTKGRVEEVYFEQFITKP